MTKRVTVITEFGTHILKADRMTLHGDTVCVYQSANDPNTQEPYEELVGMFREECVKAAYATEQNGENRQP